MLLLHLRTANAVLETPLGELQKSEQYPALSLLPDAQYQSQKVQRLKDSHGYFEHFGGGRGGYGRGGLARQAATSNAPTRATRLLPSTALTDGPSNLSGRGVRQVLVIRPDTLGSTYEPTTGLAQVDVLSPVIAQRPVEVAFLVSSLSSIRVSISSVETGEQRGPVAVVRALSTLTGLRAELASRFGVRHGVRRAVNPGALGLADFSLIYTVF